MALGRERFFCPVLFAARRHLLQRLLLPPERRGNSDKAVLVPQLTSSPRLRRGIPYCVADLAVSRFDGFLLLDGLCRLT